MPTKRTRPIFALLHLGTGVVLVLCWLFFSAPGEAQAPPHEARYFPETGHYLRGTFRTFWETYGGRYVFGLPITEDYVASSNGRITQYFERARFELVEQNGQPYVELGKLGLEYAAGRTFETVPPIPNSYDWYYFPETQHVIQKGFKQIWETYGQGRMFGYPISEEILEPFPDGTVRTVQYFERVRFEYWPEFPPGQRVVISALGRHIAPLELQASLPPTAAPGTVPEGSQAVLPQAPAVQAERPASGVPVASSVPAQAERPASDAPAASSVPAANMTTEQVVTPTMQTNWRVLPLPENVEAHVSPEIGAPGTSFLFTAYSFKPHEAVGVWLTAPDGATIALDIVAQADERGALTQEPVVVPTRADYRDGIWSVNAQGIESDKQSVAFFRISRVVNAVAGNPSNLNILLHDQLPSSEGVTMMPLAAPAGTSFVMLASGYEPGEAVSSWITASDGETTTIDGSSAQIDSNGVVQLRFTSASLSEGIYSVVAQGQRSGATNTAMFKITSTYVAGPGTPQPDSFNGQATPSAGGAGTVFRIRGSGMLPNEAVEFWITEPTGSYTLLPDPVVADSQGRIGYQPMLDMFGSDELVPGVYGLHFRGTQSGARADIYYTYVSGQ